MAAVGGVAPAAVKDFWVAGSARRCVALAQTAQSRTKMVSFLKAMMLVSVEEVGEWSCDF